MIRVEVYDRKLARARVSILEYYPMVEKCMLYQDKFIGFESLVTTT
jgi:hypothetical protein